MIFNIRAQFVPNRSDTKTQDDCNVTNLRCGACVQMSACCARITRGTPAESIKKFISRCSAHCGNLPSKASHFESYLTGAGFYVKETIRISLLYANVLELLKPQRDKEKVCGAHACARLDGNVIFCLIACCIYTCIASLGS